jgi:hypothetical protein
MMSLTVTGLSWQRCQHNDRSSDDETRAQRGETTDQREGTDRAEAHGGS